MRRSTRMTAGLAARVAATALVAAGGSAAMAAGSGDLTFGGDAGFQGAHGGQTVHVALVSGGDLVAEESVTVSASDDPAFSVTFPGMLEDGQSYEVHYWIDSNFGGGSEGICDPADTDHQWNVPLGSVEGDVTHTEQHRPGDTAAVCGTFTM